MKVFSSRNFNKIKLFLLFVFVLATLAVGLTFWRQFSFPDSDYKLEKGRRVELGGGDRVEQVFWVSQDGLAALEILLSGRLENENTKLEFFLKDRNCQQVLAKREIKGKRSFNSKYPYLFNFPRIKHSKNRYFCLEIEFTSEKSSKKNKIRFFVNNWFKGDNQRDEQNGVERKVKERLLKPYILNGSSEKNKKKHSIFLRPRYRKVGIWRNIDELNKRMSQYKPWFLKGKFLYLLTGVMFVLLVVEVGLLLFL